MKYFASGRDVKKAVSAEKCKAVRIMGKGDLSLCFLIAHVSVCLLLLFSWLIGNNELIISYYFRNEAFAPGGVCTCDPQLTRPPFHH